MFRSIVFVQATFSRKICVTVSANVRPLSGMNTIVNEKLFRGDESSGTEGALVGPIRGVTADNVVRKAVSVR